MSDTKQSTTRAGSPMGGRSSSIGGVEKLLDDTQAALSAIQDTATSTTYGTRAFRLRDFASASSDATEMDPSAGGMVTVSVELGRTEMQAGDVPNLRRGSVVALDELAGEPVSVLLNNHVIARGEIVVLDGCFCVRITQQIQSGGC